MTREGFDDLLETLLLQAEVLELRADNKVRGRRTLLENSSEWLLEGSVVVTMGHKFLRLKDLSCHS